MNIIDAWDSPYYYWCKRQPHRQPERLTSINCFTNSISTVPAVFDDKDSFEDLAGIHKSTATHITLAILFIASLVYSQTNELNWWSSLLNSKLKTVYFPTREINIWNGMGKNITEERGGCTQHIELVLHNQEGEEIISICWQISTTRSTKRSFVRHRIFRSCRSTGLHTCKN